MDQKDKTKRQLIRRGFWVMMVILSVLSCSKEDEAEYFVDGVLMPYFDLFGAEAAERGIQVDFSTAPVSGYIRVITTQQVIGQCVHQEDQPNTVIVDKLYWDTATQLEREFLVFHELGHCVLNRGHLDDADQQGFCVSMMTSGTGLCQVRYTAVNREAMLDELFQQ